MHFTPKIAIPAITVRLTGYRWTYLPTVHGLGNLSDMGMIFVRL